MQTDRESQLRVGGSRGGGFSYKRKPYRETSRDERRCCIRMCTAGRTYPALRYGGISVSHYIEVMASSLWPVYPLRIFTG